MKLLQFVKWWWGAARWPDRLVVVMLLGILAPANLAAAVFDLGARTSAWLFGATAALLLPWALYNLIDTERMVRRFRRERAEFDRRLAELNDEEKGA